MSDSVNTATSENNKSGFFSSLYENIIGIVGRVIKSSPSASPPASAQSGGKRKSKRSNKSARKSRKSSRKTSHRRR
jgi:hypothetical protein